MTNTPDFSIRNLGECSIPSPIALSRSHGDFIANYVTDDSRILYDIITEPEKEQPVLSPHSTLERAGPREHIFFEPSDVHAGIVTCGGLCPGLNDVIRAIIMCLWYRYKVRTISGIRYGYRGLLPEYSLKPVSLTPDCVVDIHQKGGTMLGSSRGEGERTSEIVDTIEREKINILFAVGGDGTQKGALAIAHETTRRDLKCAVLGIPKTIDNDLNYLDKSFGFETAVSLAADVIYGAHVEAHDALHGISIVKVMGRQSGFIAAHTALANNDVNYVLIPEVPFELTGEKGLLQSLHARLDERNHAVILVAEGAGQSLLPPTGKRDASGNIKLGDIGLFLVSELKSYFTEKGFEINLKYIDPSYIIRSAPANTHDSVYCARLGTNIVHAAMAGKTDMLISCVNNHFVHVPIEMAVSRKNSVDPESSLWRDVMEVTGQPPLMKN